jgi:hypothetical protein
LLKFILPPNCCDYIKKIRTKNEQMIKNAAGEIFFFAKSIIKFYAKKPQFLLKHKNCG